jgi:hypothetical protein
MWVDILKVDVKETGSDGVGWTQILGYGLGTGSFEG